MQSIVRKDSNSGHEEQTEVENTMDYSLSVEELHIEESNNITWIIEISSVVEERINVYRYSI